MTTNDGLRVEPEVTRRDRRAFIDLPYRLYRHDPVWAPPLRLMMKSTMDRSHPFFEHGDVAHFLARRGRRVVGRIAAIENRLHNETHTDRLGFFGFFDVESDPEAARALVEAAKAWTQDRGLSPMRGPVSYSTNDTCGVLVDGFDLTPAVLMPYNRPDYDGLLKGAGLQPVKDLLAFEIPAENGPPERFRRVVTRRLERSGIRLRPFNTKNLVSEVPPLRDMYNASWESNWGFVPATHAEFVYMAKDLGQILDPDLSAIAEKDGEAVGFSIVIRDINTLLKGTNGRLFPFGLAKLLWGLKRVDHVRVIALGIRPEMRRRGINEALFLLAMDGARDKGMRGGEAGWILEDNEPMQSPIRLAGGEAVKRYRLYESPETGAS